MRLVSVAKPLFLGGPAGTMWMLLMDPNQAWINPCHGPRRPRTKSFPVPDSPSGTGTILLMAAQRVVE